MKKKSNFFDVLRDTQQALLARYDNPTLCNQYAWWMIQAISKKSEAQLITQKLIDWDDAQQAQLQKWIDQQVQHHEPLQYLLGSVPFCDVDILVKPPVLIPRPETEEWCIKLIEYLITMKNQKINILDVCSGSGCIAIALAKALPKATVFGVDIDDNALSLSQLNAHHNHVSNVTFLRSNLFEALSDAFRFDIIISNPPYISQEEYKTLDTSVREWESKRALVAADDGLALIKKIIKTAPSYIQPNNELKEKNIPQLIIEIGYQQGPDVASYMKQQGYSHVRVQRDLEGKDRVVTGRIE